MATITNLSEKRWSDIPLADEARYLGLERPMLPERVGVIVEKLRNDIELLGDGNPYFSCIYFTPQGNQHTAFANGKVKPQGEEIRPIKCVDLTEGAQVRAFQEAADATLAVIRHEKPEGRSRLIWRQQPEATRVLREDGLYVKIYTRIGWDKSEETTNG